MLRKIQGRTTDFVVSKDSAVIHGLVLIYVLRGIDSVAQFTISHDAPDQRRVLIVLIRRLSAGAFDETEAGFRYRLGRDFWVEIVVCDSIPIETSGEVSLRCEQCGQQFRRRAHLTGWFILRAMWVPWTVRGSKVRQVGTNHRSGMLVEMREEGHA